MLDQRYSDNDESKRDIPSFIEPRPPLISNPFMRPRPQKGTNLLELFEEEIEEPELVQVYLRMKPHHAINNLYEVKSDRCLITSVDTATAGHGRRTQHNVSKMYTFSHIFGPEASQKEIFEKVVKDNLKKLPDGHSFTLLTYGASGSGKTFTLMGTVPSPGLVPRSLEYVFRVVDAAQHPVYKPFDGGAEKLNLAEQDFELQWVKRLRHVSAPLRDKYRRMSAGLCNDFTASSLDLSNRTRHYVWVSFVEIYNEGIYDLLSTSDRSNASKLRIREDANGHVYLKDASQAFVRSASEAYDVMAAGKHQLQVAATGVHAHSSRSHCIFTITMLTETDNGVRTSCVRLCDLAGCERARRTRNTGARMLESRAINSSLHVLERCLHTLRRRQRLRAPPATCVPYRESKLTRLLGAGLSGARGEAVAMVVTLNPAPEYAHETKHVLQLAAVARDIQVNSTIAETTTSQESSIVDTTVSCSADVMRLRSDNERLHFELLQAQARNRELMAVMEEKQQEAANTMRELVEEAKDMTRQYYEAQLQALRTEMEDMAEEYESRLNKAAAGVETPSRSLQKKVSQLMTEIALLEEKLTAEHLARARAEEEVQHLRACIEERDEKAFEENTPANQQDVMSLSESEEEEEDDDPLNETLEPIFKKENINRSRVITSFIDRHSVHYDSTVPSYHENTEFTADNTENDYTNKSGDILKDHNDSSEETTKDYVYATGDDDGGAINKTNCNELHKKSKYLDARQIIENEHPNIAIENNVQPPENPLNNISVCENIENYKKLSNEGSMRGTYFVKEEVEIEDKYVKHPNIENIDNNKKLSNEGSMRGTYFVKDNEEVEIEDKCVKHTNIENIGNNKKLSNEGSMRSTYFVKDNDEVEIEDKCVKHSNIENIDSNKKLSNEGSVRGTYFVKDNEEVEIEDKCVKHPTIESINNNKKLSNEESMRGTYFVKDIEEVKIEDKYVKHANIDNIKSFARGTYFASEKNIHDSPEADVSKENPKGPNIANKDKTDDITAVKVPEILVNKIIKSVKKTQGRGRDDSLAQFEQLEMAAKDCKESASGIANDFGHVKLLKEKRTYFDDKPLDIVAEERVPSPKIIKEKQTYFESTNLDNERTSSKKVHEILNNINKYDYTRSPSIVKDDVLNDYKPSTIKILLGESLTRQPDIISSVHKNSILHKKHDSIDIFEGLDSPQLNVKTTESHDIVESARECIKQLVLEQKSASKLNAKQDNQSGPLVIHEELFKEPTTVKTHKKDSVKKSEIVEVVVSQNGPQLESNQDNTIEEFENIYKGISAPRPTEFDILISQETSMSVNKEVKTSVEETKYNLRHKSHTKDLRFADNKEQEEMEEVLMESSAKCESVRSKPTKRSLRLRKRRNLTESEDKSDQEMDKLKEKDNLKLKDIVNLQKEFSDVTMDVPAPAKTVKDIASPEKPAGEEENVPPILGVQSCPAKSVTRSRRKLFTPRAEPLDEGEAPADSGERVYVPRPSYHRARARRKL